MNRLAFIALVILGLTTSVCSQTLEKEVLAFDSFEHLEAFQTKLISMTDEYNRGLEAQYGESLEKFIEDKHPCPWDPIIRWSQSIGFVSLLDITYQAQAAWLEKQKDNDETATEPRSPFIASPEDQAVLNAWNEIKIGKTYYRLNQAGQETYDSLDALIASRRIAQTSTATTLKRRLQVAGCSNNWWNTYYYTCSYNSKARTKAVVAHYWWFFKYRAHTSTQCFKKGWFGIWWWSFTYHFARSYGGVSAPMIIGCSVENNYCRTQHIFNTLTSANYNQGNGFWISHNVCVPTKTRSTWVRGEHKSKCCDQPYYTVLYF